MNKLNYFLLIGVIAGITTLVGCGDDNAPEIDPEQAVTERFSNTWIIDDTQTINQVITPAGDRTDDFVNFSLIINENNSYSTSGSPERSPWPASGTWSFTNPDNITSANQNTFLVTRNDGLVMNAQLSNDDTNLTLTFEFDEGLHDGNMRIMAVSGQWTFHFVAQ